MKHVNEILDGKKLDEFISESGKDKILELRASASIALGAEKKNQRLWRQYGAAQKIHWVSKRYHSGV